jgi:hypothetical protein
MSLSQSRLDRVSPPAILASIFNVSRERCRSLLQIASLEGFFEGRSPACFCRQFAPLGATSGLELRGGILACRLKGFPGLSVTSVGMRRIPGNRGAQSGEGGNGGQQISKLLIRLDFPETSGWQSSTPGAKILVAAIPRPWYRQLAIMPQANL